MKPFFTVIIVLLSLSGFVNAQGFIGASIASIQNKARPDSVELREMDGYYLENLGEGHAALYYVTGFAKDGICTSYEYLVPLSEKPMLTEWLNRFYIKKSKDTWRSHSGIMLSLTTEDDKVRLVESKPVVAAVAPTSPATNRVLLRGTWISADDKNSALLITDKQYVEKYKGRADDSYSLAVLDRPCDAKPGTKPDGGLYLKIASSDPDHDDECYYVVSVSANRLEISPAGRANTIRFNRARPQSGKK